MARRKRPVSFWIALGVGAGLLFLAGVIYGVREDILRAELDPKQPFQTYTPPPAPNYAQRSSWALLPADPAHATAADLPVDVFFVHPTTFDGGRDWLGPIGQPEADRFLFRVVLPNDAGPFARVGRMFAPRYRQASLYASSMTLRDDAQEARRFAYRDVKAAFLAYLLRYNQGRPLILAGSGQGAKLLSHLLQDVVAPNVALRQRIVAVYLMDVALPAAEYGPTAAEPACRSPNQTHCVLAWAAVRAMGDFASRRMLARAMIWTPDGRLESLNGRTPLCVNPLLGAQSEDFAPPKLNRGAANATGLEWGLRPAFTPHQVSAQCQNGLLRVSSPSGPSLQRAGFWVRRRKARPFNLFYLDIEADAQTRVEAMLGRRFYGPPAAPITNTVNVVPSTVHRIS